VAYDPIFGGFGGTRGGGFGGRATGSRFANIYGYNQGQAVTNPQQWAQMQAQQNQPVQQPSNPGPGNDFFSQLAGLMGGAAPGNKPAGNPNVARQPFNLGQAIAQPGSQYRAVTTPGGVGPYGGIAQGDQRKMFEGRARGFGSMGSSPFSSGGYGRYGGGR
jgi:hypothetical protein